MIDVNVIASFPEAVYAKKGFYDIQVKGEGTTTAIATVRAIWEVFKHPQMRDMRPNCINFRVEVGGRPQLPHRLEMLFRLGNRLTSIRDFFPTSLKTGSMHICKISVLDPHESAR